MNLEKGPSNKEIESFTLKLKNPNNLSPIKVELGRPHILISFEEDGGINVKIDPILLEGIEVTKIDFR